MNLSPWGCFLEMDIHGECEICSDFALILIILEMCNFVFHLLSERAFSSHQCWKTLLLKHMYKMYVLCSNKLLKSNATCSKLHKKMSWENEHLMRSYCFCFLHVCFLRVCFCFLRVCLWLAFLNVAIVDFLRNNLKCQFESIFLQFTVENSYTICFSK